VGSTRQTFGYGEENEGQKVSPWIRGEPKSQSEFPFGPEPFRLVREILVEPGVAPVEVVIEDTQGDLF
jgi:hypothetical protein